MSQCPYTNLLDPDLYAAGNHLPKLQALRDQADAPIIKIDDPLQGVPYWAVLEREHADYIAKNPAIFSSEKKLMHPTEQDEETIAMQSQMLVSMDPPNMVSIAVLHAMLLNLRPLKVMKKDFANTLKKSSMRLQQRGIVNSLLKWPPSYR